MEISIFEPCAEALEFRKKYSSFEEAWENCSRGDWMLWIASKLKINHRTLTLAKSRCARTVIHLMKDKRSIYAVNVAERYGTGNASDDELKNAYDAAYAAAAAAYAAYAAADPPAYDAYAYAAAAYAAAAYAAATDVADAAAAANADADARIKNQLKTADICREILTEEVFKAIKTI